MDCCRGHLATMSSWSCYTWYLVNQELSGWRTGSKATRHLLPKKVDESEETVRWAWYVLDMRPWPPDWWGWEVALCLERQLRRGFCAQAFLCETCGPYSGLQFLDHLRMKWMAIEESWGDWEYIGRTIEYIRGVFHSSFDALNIRSEFWVGDCYGSPPPTDTSQIMQEVLILHVCSDIEDKTSFGKESIGMSEFL